MIAPGVLAQQALLAGGGGGGVRPVLRAQRQFGANAAAQTVLLPVGWQAGDLFVLLIAASDTTNISISGWSAFGFQSGTGLRLYAFTRVAQAGDEGSFSVAAGGRRACIITAFEGGTYNPSQPFLSAAAGTSGFGTSVATEPGNLEIPAGLHYVIALGACGTAAIGTVTYPNAQINTRQGASSSVVTFTWVMASGGDFDGGFTEVDTFTIGNGMDWVSRAVVVRGLD